MPQLAYETREFIILGHKLIIQLSLLSEICSVCLSLKF